MDSKENGLAGKEKKAVRKRKHTKKNMDSSILKQYVDLREEIRDLEERIKQKEKLIREMDVKNYTVKDSVKGTRQDGTIGSISIEGFPYPEYSRQKSLLQASVLRARSKRNELIELTAEIEKYINSMPDPRTRRLFKFRYMDKLSWTQVACRMGGKCTAESCRAVHNRFLGIKK